MQYCFILFWENRTGKRGLLKLHDGKIDFENQDTTRCTEYKVDKGRLYGLKAYSKALRRFVSLAMWYPMDGRTDKWLLISPRTSAGDQGGSGLLQNTFPARILLPRYQATCRNSELSVTRLQKTSVSLQRITCSNKPCQGACKKMGVKYSISSWSQSYTILTCLNDLFTCLGLDQTHIQLTDFSKNSFHLRPKPLRLGQFLRIININIVSQKYTKKNKKAKVSIQLFTKKNKKEKLLYFKSENRKLQLLYSSYQRIKNNTN